MAREALDDGPVPQAVRWLADTDCDNCGAAEERCWTDSWTGKVLCQSCLWPIIGRLTNSPASEGDNLNATLQEEEG